MPPQLPHLLCFSLLLLPFSITVAQTSNRISLGSALSTLEPAPYWRSPSGEFAFGFYPLLEKQNLFLLAIWFAQIPIKTIVWTANGDQPVQKGSRVQLTNTGTLSLINSNGVEIWKAEPLDGTRASYASMLDSGNFVLLSSDSSVKWGTFDQPTDTILPTQILNRGEKLFSRQTELDFSTGRFQLALKVDGDLVLYTMARQTKDIYSSYWSSNTKDSGSRLVFDQNGDLFLALVNGKIFNFTTKNPVSTRDYYYHRATLDFDGVFRKYKYPKNPTKDMNWPQSWAISWFIPIEICTAVLGENGSGVCGFNSYCILDQEQRPQCKCPPGYDYLNPKDTFRGCKQVFGPQSCSEDDDDDDVNVITRGFEMRTMINTDWPLCDYEHFELVNEEWCSETCLKDCFCAVSIFRQGNCWLKKWPLSNGRMDTSVGGKAFVKVGSATNHYH